MRSLPRPLVAALFGLGLWALVPAVHAAEMVIKTSPGKPAINRAVEPDADENLGRLAKKPSPKPPLGAGEEGMDKLRERLAEKLGANKTVDSPDPSVLRVVSRPSAAGGAGSMDVPPGIHWSEPQRRPAAPKSVVKKYPEHWSYQGEGGPENWGQMKPEFSMCSSGKRQSPIDIRDQISVQLDPVQFDYKPSSFRVIDNGHTVQVNVSAGSSIEVMGRRFELVQFHFHRPSEERINGRQFDMVAHLVHKDLEGRLAVVAVLLDRGSAQPIVQQVWNNLPLEKGEELAAKAPIDLNGLLPAERGYFTYMGSLTTPPCSEGVLWMVMRTPVSISPEQVGIFSRLYPMNARPIQAASGRLIKGSN
ncbi:carbonic anhydrase [Sphaerotilaceae bacterium SBD11-9]